MSENFNWSVERMMLFLPLSGKNRIRGAFALKLQKSQDERSFWPDVGGEN